MPLPQWLARFNRGATNRVTRLVAGRLRGFGIVVHQGRRSGRRYRTPVNAFRHPPGYVIALTYGEDSDWVRNVLASRRCVLETAGRSVTLVDPQIVVDPAAQLVPAAVRPILRALDVDHFMVLTARR